MPIDYDPLLAKLSAYGEDRAQVISRLTRALQELFVGGIKTNAGLFRRILADEDFQSGKIDTGYLERLGSPAWFRSNRSERCRGYRGGSICGNGLNVQECQQRNDNGCWRRSVSLEARSQD